MRKKIFSTLFVTLIALALIAAQCGTSTEAPPVDGTPQTVANATPDGYPGPGNTQTVVAPPRASATPSPVVVRTATPVATANPADEAALKVRAEKVWGESLPWPVESYSAHEGEDGYPQICAGLCYDTSKVSTNGVMKWYGPSEGEEDISQSAEKFGNGTPGPLELMQTGKVTTVIFPLSRDSAKIEACALPGAKLDGVLLTNVLKTPDGQFVKEGECGVGVIGKGWHTVEGSANSPVAGFGVRFVASQWASMDEAKVQAFTSFWTVQGDTATWNTQTVATAERASKADTGSTEVLMTPSLISMMQDFRTLNKVVFGTNQDGKVLLCNGTLSSSAGKTWSSKDGSCKVYEVPAGTYTYVAPSGNNRTSSGISWKPLDK